MTAFLHTAVLYGPLPPLFPRQVAVTHHARKHGVSKYSALGRIPRVICDLLTGERGLGSLGKTGGGGSAA